jgi:hypothetical protein
VERDIDFLEVKLPDEMNLGLFLVDAQDFKNKVLLEIE